MSITFAMVKIVACMHGLRDTYTNVMYPKEISF